MVGCDVVIFENGGSYSEVHYIGGQEVNALKVDYPAALDVNNEKWKNRWH